MSQTSEKIIGREPTPSYAQNQRRISPSACRFPPGKLHLDGIERGLTSDAYYHVTLEDGRSGYIDAFIVVTFAADIDPAQIAAECKRRGEPRVGMTAKQVEATCWGKPGHVDRLKTTRGNTDRYVYEQGRVILKNGIVTAVGTLQ